MIYGELNAFSPASAQRIIDKAHAAQKPGGALLLEVSHADAIRLRGQEPPSWYTAESGLFSDRPHLVLMESSVEDGCSCSWHYVVDTESGEVDEYVAMHQAYTDEDFQQLLRAYTEITEYPSLTGDADGGEFFVLVARK